ncbi:MAG: hypothetical protein EBT22_07470 [Chloroflexi bacterium]|nr:hypothetical protein [Chloroflexota bacterium]
MTTDRAIQKAQRDHPAISVTLALDPDENDSYGSTASGRMIAEGPIALANAVFAHLRQMHGPNVHISVTTGTLPIDECVTAGISPDPEFEILDAIASIREAQLSTGSVRNSSVRVVLPDGIVLEQAAGAAPPSRRPRPLRRRHHPDTYPVGARRRSPCCLGRRAVPVGGHDASRTRKRFHPDRTGKQRRSRERATASR